MTKTKLKIVTITGRTCSGKSTLEEALVKTGHYGKVISHTTRPRRSGEIDGVDYHFVSKQVFDSLWASGQFLETVNFGGNHYGASRSETDRIFAEGKNVVVVVEPVGREQIQHYCRNNGLSCVSVFLYTPDDIIAERFLRRAFDEIFKAGLTDDAEEAVVAQDAVLLRYAARLGTILTLEQHWRPAVSHLRGDVVSNHSIVADGRSLDELVAEVNSKVDAAAVAI